MKTISRKNLPARLPIVHTALAILLLDYYDAPQWLYGVIGCILVMLWIAAIYTKSKEKEVDLFEESKTQYPPVYNTKTKSKFQEKLEEMRRQQS